MLNRLKQKLNSKNGASLLFAMLFFIMCAVIGSIVLTSASGVSGQLSVLQEKDRSYYAVSSAANYIKDELGHNDTNEREFVITDIKTEQYAAGQAADPVSVTYTETDFVQKNAATDTSLILGKIRECFSNYTGLSGAERWAGGNDVYSMGQALESSDYTINVTGYPDLQVQMSLEMNEFAEIKIHLSVGYDTYALDMELMPTVDTAIATEINEEEDAREFITTKTTTIKYETQNITVTKG